MEGYGHGQPAMQCFPVRDGEAKREEYAFWIDAPMVVHPQLAQTVSSRQHHFVRRCSRGKCSARPGIVAKCRACVRDMETRSLAHSACGFNAVPPRLARFSYYRQNFLGWLRKSLNPYSICRARLPA